MNSSGFIFYIGSCLDRLCICIVQLDRLKLFSQIWVKASAEQQFLYGHHIMKSGLGRITENTPKWAFLKIWSLKFLPSSGTRVWSCTAWLTCPLGLELQQKPPRSAGTRTPWTLLHSTRCRLTDKIGRVYLFPIFAGWFGRIYSCWRDTLVKK